MSVDISFRDLKMKVYFGFYIVAHLDRNALGSEFGEGPPQLDNWTEALPNVWIPTSPLREQLGGVRLRDDGIGGDYPNPFTHNFDNLVAARKVLKMQEWETTFTGLSKKAVQTNVGCVVWY